MNLMSAVLERGNMMRAYERVLRNKGAAGVLEPQLRFSTGKECRAGGTTGP